jgi:hypothetical protein
MENAMLLVNERLKGVERSQMNKAEKRKHSGNQILWVLRDSNPRRALALRTKLHVTLGGLQTRSHLIFQLE